MTHNRSSLINKNSEHGSLFLSVRNSLLAFSCLVLAACTPQPQETVLSGPTMGTDYRVTVVTQGISKEQQDALHQQIKDAMEAVNQSMSTYIEDSELSLFNQADKDSPATMSQGLFDVVSEALQISEFSQGAFDPTLGKVIRLWGFGADGRITKMPDLAQLENLKASVGYQLLRIDGNVLSKSVDDVELNLSAIAKGYAVDKVAEAIVNAGYSDFLVNIGGELRSSGTSLEGKLWTVGVEKPHVTGGIAQVVNLDNSAIATSGDYRNYHVIDGQHYSHTIDPTTLSPIYHKLASVSVITPKASTADALATALLTMGDQQAVEFAEKNAIAAYFIIRTENADNYRIHATEQFKTYLPE